MGNPSGASCENSFLKTVTLEKTLIDPEGRLIALVVVGEAASGPYLLDIVENAQDILDWMKAERMGEDNGTEH